MRMSKSAKRYISDEKWRFVMAGMDILVHRDRIKCKKEVDDYHINDVNTIEYYNEEAEFTGEVSLSVICQYLEIPDIFI